MKIKVKPAKFSTAKFRCGEFFINKSGELKQIVEIDGGYIIVDVRGGHQATGKYMTADMAAKTYAEFNGTIKKVKLDEVHLLETNEIIEEGFFK